MKSFKIITLILFLTTSLMLLCQDLTPGSPLHPGKVITPWHFGLFGGINYPLRPAELTATPSSGAISKAQKSLLNGFDGLGFSGTYIFGIMARYPISSNLFIGPDISFSGWKSRINCDCGKVNYYESQNSLTNFSIAIVPQFYYYNNLFISPEVNLNFLGVHSSENDSVRGKTDFSKSYTRIGAGVALGYEYYFRKTALSLTLKVVSPNLLLKQSNPQNWTDSKTIVSSGTSSDESTLLFFSLNLGLVYQLTEIFKGD